jgi:hypothetical protein
VESGEAAALKAAAGAASRASGSGERDHQQREKRAGVKRGLADGDPNHVGNMGPGCAGRQSAQIVGLRIAALRPARSQRGAFCSLANSARRTEASKRHSRPPPQSYALASPRRIAELVVAAAVEQSPVVESGSKHVACRQAFGFAAGQIRSVASRCAHSGLHPFPAFSTRAPLGILPFLWAGPFRSTIA